MAVSGRQLAWDFGHEEITQAAVDALVAEMREVYLRDERPWVIGFSGGKDSTAVVQLVYRMLMALPAELRTKTVHVISSNTLVENPRVAAWLEKCQEELRTVARECRLPVEVVTVYPDPRESFWVLLIGRGYPAPTQDFRWCTGRLKIAPAEAYVLKHIDCDGRILQLLGSRKAESRARAASIEAHALDGKFGTCGSLSEGISYQPIQDWTNDHVWEFLRLFPTPWNRPGDTLVIPDHLTGKGVPHYNNELFALYQAGHGGECVMDFDKRTASCGGSRFGCWTCTVVTQDRSMTNMVNMEHPEYAPLLAFRQKTLDYRADRTKRAPEGRNGRLRVNSRARLTAAKEHAGENKALIDAFISGAKWAVSDHYSPENEAERVSDTACGPDVESRAAFAAGLTWASAVLETGADSESITPGPYYHEVRLEFLRDLFEIEQNLSGFCTVTDDDLRGIRYEWEQDGGPVDQLDALIAEYRGGESVG